MTEEDAWASMLTVDINPFDNDYVRRELAFYGNVDWKSGKTLARMGELVGRHDDYLNKQFQTGEFKVPLLESNGKFLMSLTPMELQSLWVPIQAAEGEVGTAGLGLGYFALRAASKEDVERVVVFEKNPAVIRFFKETFKDREELAKIEIIKGDARKKLQQWDFDLLFVDIYGTLMAEEVVTDIPLFMNGNAIGQYRFWTQELVKFACVLYFKIGVYRTMLERAFFHAWQQSEERVGMATGDHFGNEDGWFTRVAQQMAEFNL